jgi:hypothetical protein
MLPRPLPRRDFRATESQVVQCLQGFLEKPDDMRNMVISSGFGAVSAIGEIATPQRRFATVRRPLDRSLRQGN